MNSFLKDLMRFVSVGFIPLLILLTCYLIMDPFKVIYNYDSYYSENESGHIELNRGHVSTKMLDRNVAQGLDYNAFIFGNSRSLFYQVDDWKSNVGDSIRPFHFDASSESIWGIRNKLNFIDKRGLDIDQVIMVLDAGVLAGVGPKFGHLFVNSPLLEKGNRSLFHLDFFEAFISPKFLYAYLDYAFTGKVKDYMDRSNLIVHRPLEYDQIYNEIKYSYFEDLAKNGAYYTPSRMRVFYKRDSIPLNLPKIVSPNSRAILEEIARVFKRHETEVKLIISPLYDQKQFNGEDLRQLKSIFGKDHVYDFSGVNRFTKDYLNYYEDSHYRPHVCREILAEIYN